MNKITWQDCGEMYFTRETNPDTGEVTLTAELIGNPLIAMSNELLLDSDPLFFKLVAEVAGFRLTRLQGGERESFWEVERIDGNE